MPNLDPTIIAVIDDWISAYQGDDPEKVIDLYADDAVVAVQGRSTITGRAAIGDLIRKSFVRLDRKVTVKYDSAEINGTWAYVYGRSWFTLAPKDGAEPTYLFGRFTTLLRLCEDGKWRIFIDMDQESEDVDPNNPHFGEAAVTH